MTVIPRSLHFCVWWLYSALQVIAEQPNFAPEVADQAKALVEPLQRMERAIPAKHRMLPQLQSSIDVVRKAIPLEFRAQESARGSKTTPAATTKKGKK